MVQNPIIAIDGFASTGKSTVARALSQHFRLPFIDSGAFYRGITLFAIENGFVKNNKVDQGGLEPKLTELDFKYDSSSSHLYLNGQDISEKINFLPKSRVGAGLPKKSCFPLFFLFCFLQNS